MVWFSFLIIRFAENLENLTPCHHEAVGGFFGASQGRADTTPFEGGNKSGASAQWPLDFDHAHARTLHRYQRFGVRPTCRRF